MTATAFKRPMAASHQALPTANETVPVNASTGVSSGASSHTATSKLSLAGHIANPGSATGAAASAAGGSTAAFETASIQRLGSGATVLALAEFAVIVACALVVKALYVDLYLGSNQPWGVYIAVGLGLGATTYLFYSQMDLYDADAVTAQIAGFGKLWGGLSLAFLVMLGLLYLFKISDTLSRGWVIIWFLASTISIFAVRASITSWLGRQMNAGRLRHRVALYGSRDFLAQLQTKLEVACPEYEIAGIYTLGQTAEASPGGQPAMGLNELHRAIQNRAYDKVIIGLPASDAQPVRATVKDLAAYSTELLLCTDLSELPVTISGSRMVGTMRMDVINSVPESERSMVLKSALDAVLALCAVILLSPILVAIAIAVKVDSPGPVFFRQRRFGQNNSVFRIFKFRSMTVQEDGKVVTKAVPNDPRVTRVGRVLRKTSLDELPQLFNVLLGDMAIVGPRPHAMAHDQAFDRQLELFTRRRRVRPGITGWAQVNGFRGETKTPEDIAKRMECDLFYVANWSIWLDIEIMVRTVLVLLRRRAY